MTAHDSCDGDDGASDPSGVSGTASEPRASGTPSEPGASGTPSASGASVAPSASGASVAPSAPDGDADCLFCRIVAGVDPASVVHTDDAVVAFLDAVPVNPGHVLVVPRVHASGLVDLPADVGAAVWRVAHRIAALMRSDPAWAEGVNLHLSDGAVADQSVGHVHLHVIPRFAGDGLRIVHDREPARPSRDELDAVAARLSRDLK